MAEADPQKTFNVHEAKTQLSALLTAVEAGEQIIIARAGKPVARLLPFEGPAQRELDLGVHAAQLVLGPGFEFLPERGIDAHQERFALLHAGVPSAVERSGVDDGVDLGLAAEDDHEVADHGGAALVRTQMVDRPDADRHRAGILRSQRGVKGGYSLARTAASSRSSFFGENGSIDGAITATGASRRAAGTYGRHENTWASGPSSHGPRNRQASSVQRLLPARVEGWKAGAFVPPGARPGPESSA